jgi:hypothetical protein
MSQALSSTYISQPGSNAIVSQDFKPGSFALRDAWFPIAHSPHVTGVAVRRLIHSQPFYLWREGAVAKAAEFHPSRLSALRSQATEFTGGSGEYPVIERYGYVWVWYGNPENAAEGLLPDVPYLPRAGAKLSRNKWGQIYFHCSYELCSENLLDLVHADYLHADFVGNEENDHDEVSVESTSETVTMIRQVTGKKVPTFLKLLGIRKDKVDYSAVAHVHLRSGVIILHGKFTPGFSQPLFHPLIPESKYLSRNNFTFNITDAPAIVRNTFPLAGYGIGPQDDVMMRRQNPVYRMESGRRDVSSRFDSAGSRYRMIMAKLIRRQQEGDFSYLGDVDPSADLSAVMGCKRAD